MFDSLLVSHRQCDRRGAQRRCQACLIKRPFNLFHRKNLYLRTAEVERSFGNKTSWDKPFEVWFRIFVDELNRATFNNGQKNRALNCDAAQIPGAYELVYVDTPYINSRGTAVDYYDFYHFLEGLTIYDEWGKHIDYESKHHRLRRRPSVWTDRSRIGVAFEELFEQKYGLDRPPAAASPTSAPGSDDAGPRARA